VEILSLRHAEMGSLAVRREWTDWAAPGTSREPISGQQPLLIDAAGLLKRFPTDLNRGDSQRNVDERVFAH